MEKQAKKITVFIGSPRKQLTYKVMEEFVEDLKAFDNIDCEYVFLKDLTLANCRGCCNCFLKGEEDCPLRDVRDLLIRTMEDSDGVVFATPNYSLNVSGIMKTFLDRLAFVFHRPRFFGRAFMGVVVQGIYGGKDIVNYLEKVGGAWGFTVGRGFCVTALEPSTPSEQKRISDAVLKAARRFHRALTRPSLPIPSFLRLMLFRLSRSSIGQCWMRPIATFATTRRRAGSNLLSTTRPASDLPKGWRGGFRIVSENGWPGSVSPKPQQSERRGSPALHIPTERVLVYNCLDKCPRCTCSA